MVVGLMSREVAKDKLESRSHTICFFLFDSVVNKWRRNREKIANAIAGVSGRIVREK